MKKPVPFGKYWLLERVNVGGMAEVFKAKAFGVEGFERIVAVKRILPNIAEDKDFIDMFIDEAKLAVQLNHANIAQIFDLGKVDDSYFIALEFILGKDLRAIFDRCRGAGDPMPISMACFVTMKVCEGLDYAHNKKDTAGREIGLVHRDVSPQNILCSYEGEIKIIDFGIAKAAGKDAKTQAGILKGKFGYMSPEQVRGLPIDRRSDLFSVGIVLYELLTGERLFAGESDFSTLEKVRNVEILPPSTYNRKVPEELERIVLKILSKDPEDRYQSGAELHDDLQAFIYTAGEFYSRKDLASWMKRTFSAEIEEETRKLEQYKQFQPELKGAETPPPRLSAPGQAALKKTMPPPPPPAALGGPPRAPTIQGMPIAQAMDMPVPGAARPAPPEPRPATPLRNGNGAAARGGHHDDEGWEEELATQVYDRDDPDTPFGDQRFDTGSTDGDGDEHEDKPTSSLDLYTENDPESGLRRVVKGPLPATEGPLPGMRREPMHDDSGSFGPAISRGTRPPSGGGPAPAFGARVAGAERNQSQKTMWAIVGGAAVAALAVAGYVVFASGAKLGKIAVTAVPTDVTVTVDEEKVSDDTPHTIERKPGTYKISLAREGYRTFTKEVELKAGERLSLHGDLEQASSDTGFVLESEPGGQKAYLDGDYLGVTPLRATKVAIGRHELVIRGEAGKLAEWKQEIAVEKGKIPTLRASLSPERVTLRVQSDMPGKAYVEVDGRRDFIGDTPAARPIDGSKKYRVIVQRAGYREFGEDVRIEGRSEVVVAAHLEKEGRREREAGMREPREPKAPRERVIKEKERPTRERVAAVPREPERAQRPEPRPTKPEPRAPKEEDRPSSGGQGFLTIGSRPSAKIILDGRDTQLWTPQRRMTVSSGKHKIQLVNPEQNINKTLNVTIVAGDEKKVIERFEASGGSEPAGGG